MGIEVTPLHPLFAAEVAGIDLAAGVDAAAVAAVRAAFEQHSVLVFHDQPLDDDAQEAFTARFGPLETTLSSRFRKGASKTRPTVSDLSNVDREGHVIPPDDPRMVFMTGNRLWHTDSSFKPVPALASLLSAREVPPEGGETEFCTLRAAYEALDDDLKAELEELVAEHSIVYSRSTIAGGMFKPEEAAELPPVRQRLVRTNPANGRKALYLGSHASHILGRPVEAGRALLRRLLRHATEPRFVYRHRWRRGDLVMWDNRAVLHRGRPFDAERHRRVMHRTTVAGAGPTVGPNAAP